MQKGADGGETNPNIGVSHGGKNTRIHALTDGLGNPVKLSFTGGNVSDCSEATALLSKVEIKGSDILADKAYGTVEIRTYVTENGANYTIPPKSNAVEPCACDYPHYKERHVAGCFFQKIKQFRCVATRYEKLIACFKGFVLLACIMILVK